MRRAPEQSLAWATLRTRMAQEREWRSTGSASSFLRAVQDRPAGSKERLDEGIGQCASGSPELGDLAMPKAVGKMVIHHPDGLHVGVDDRRAYEREAAALEILAHGVRLAGVSGNLPDSSPTILKRAAVDEAPLIRVEVAELRLD